MPSRWGCWRCVELVNFYSTVTNAYYLLYMASFKNLTSLPRANYGGKEPASTTSTRTGWDSKHTLRKLLSKVPELKSCKWGAYKSLGKTIMTSCSAWTFCTKNTLNRCDETTWSKEVAVPLRFEHQVPLMTYEPQVAATTKRFRHNFGICPYQKGTKYDSFILFLEGHNTAIALEQETSVCEAAKE